MSRLRNNIKKALIERGFTGEIKLFWWSKDGWYAHCDQFQHVWVGQHSKHAVESINKGLFDTYLTE